jgi:hypothetical protein
MVEVELRAVHAVTVEMHGGMLTLAAVCVMVKMADLIYQRFLPGKIPRLYGILARVSALAGPTALLAAIGGLVGLVLSAVTGYLLVPGKSLTEDPLAMNKVMVSIFAMELWSIFILLGLRYPKHLWKSRRFSVMASGIALMGYASSVVGGSLGGTMAGKGSVLDPVWEFLGVDLHASWIMTPNLALIVVTMVNLIGVVVIILSLKGAHAQSSAEKPTP